jgi:hypothetical protein
VWTLIVTIKNAQSEQRAWVVFRELPGPGATTEEQQTMIVSNDRASLMATFINVGGSPAFDVVIRPGHMILDADVPLSCNMTQLPGEPISRGVVPNNDQDRPLRLEIIIEGLTPDILREITETKTKRLFVGGLVEYKDFFFYQRRTGFCLHYVPEAKTASFQYCPCLNWVE